MAKNSTLYEDRMGNVKSRRAKTVKTDAKTTKKGKAFSPEPSSSRPEDRYGVRRRARGKSLGASASRLRERVGLVV